jgi:hypothetical protein
MAQIGVLNAFPNEKPIVRKETASGAYRLSTYYVAKALADAPFSLLTPLAFGLTGYYLTPLQKGAAHFAVFVGLLLLTSMAGTAAGMVVSAVAPDAMVANAVAPALGVVFILFSAFVINVDSLGLVSGRACRHC